MRPVQRDISCPGVLNRPLIMGICEEYDRFIGTQTEFCRLHGITGSSLRYWRLKQETSFVEVASPEAAAWDVELAFADGTVLRLRRP